MAFVYNIISSKIGGIKLELNAEGDQNILYKIDTLSLAKTMLVIYLIIGFVYGIITMIFLYVTGAQISQILVSGISYMFTNQEAIIAYPIVYTIIGLIASLVCAFAYNIIASKIGGISFNLTSTDKYQMINSIGIMSVAKVSLLFYMIIGLIVGGISLITINALAIIIMLVFPIIGFTGGAVFAVIFNVTTPLVGGVGIRLE